MAKHLEKTLSWVREEKNGLERFVEFFQETTVLEEAYNDLPKNYFFFLVKNRQFINDLGKFIRNVGSPKDDREKKNQWNRTLDGEIPSSESIFIFIDDIQRMVLDENGVEIRTRSVAKHLERRQKPIAEEKKCLEKYSEQIKQGGEIIDEITCTFMRDNYELLQKINSDYKNH